jgi:hypothetical protein
LILGQLFFTFEATKQGAIAMKAIKYFACILLFGFSSQIYSQIPDTVWTKTFGGPLADVGNSVKQTRDGGFIIAATTSSFGAGGQDIWLIKTDENGDTLWTKTFGGTGNDRAANVVQTNDNGFAVFGTTNSFGNGGDDFLLWKTDSLGHTEWNKTFGSISNERAYEGHQTSDSGYVIVGDSLGSNNKAWIIKTDKDGNFIWGSTVGSSNYGTHFHGNSIQQLDDGGYALCGIERYIFGGSYAFEYFFSRISSVGNIIISRYYGVFAYALGVIVKKLSDGNLILGGTVIMPFIGSLDEPLILKTDQYGNVIWEEIILGSQYPAVLTSIEPTNDNGFIFTIYGPNISLLKCYQSGILAWEKIVGGPQDDQAYSINLTSDSGYIVTGYTKSFGAGNSDIWLLKFKNNLPNNITVVSPNGGEHLSIRDSIEIKWNSVSVDSVRIKLSLNGGTNWITIVDSTPSDSTYKWFVQVPNPSWNCLIKISDVADSTIYDKSDSTFAIDRFLSVDDSSRLLPKEFSLSQNFPNPFNPSTKIKYTIPASLNPSEGGTLVRLAIYDVLGNEIATLINEEKQPGTYEVEFSPESSIKNPASGVYFYQLKAGNFVDTKKMLLLK